VSGEPAPETGTGPTPPPTATSAAPSGRSLGARTIDFLAEYAVLVLLAIVFVWLSFASPAFLSTANIFNILNQNAPLAIVACAGTLVIIGGGFDLSTGAILGVASVTAAWVAVNIDPVLGILLAPFVGIALGLANGVIITGLKVHSFLVTLATNFVFRGIALAITGGFLISVSSDIFRVLGRSELEGIPVFDGLKYAVLVFIVFAAAMWIILDATPLGRYIYAVGGNQEAAVLSGVRVDRVIISTFVLSGLAAGIAGAITVSRIGSGQPAAGENVALEAIAAIILGGTSIYGGKGAVWRSIAGVYLLALIGNGWNILNLDPQLRIIVVGLVILAALALGAVRGRRR
jgi:ribose transport system permease protein